MRIAIFGANGQTGRLVTRRALDAGHTAVAVTRRPDEFPFSDPALTVAGADVHDTDAVLHAVADADAVVSTLGVPFTREPVNTYSRGTANIVAAMQSSGVTRLVVVSSTGAYPAPGRTGTPFALRLFEPVITKTIGKTVYDDIRLMESVVRESEVDWTIVRPSGLFDLPYVTEYTAGEVDPIGAFTSRADLADYLVALAANHGGGHDTVTISTTENTPTMWQMIRREAFSSAS
ncbi:putative NADH-flavin reductase [Mycobacterium sp. JS623]|uniref:NAD(P)-dependent oxidoreductase n=1 Tax=Mycobacterium sp. JS623 TaxID=212767 RepID=UPI0002A5618B|nr:NAD(P)H-binding protein [Mycobacterium sp. JS623]AGB22585.1 putative NADH-flavin reductase [Mycobacterium sp. JS623]